MRQLLVCATFVALVATAACGSDSNNSTGTVDTFTGTWQGTFEGAVQITANASQTGDSVSGTVAFSFGGTTYNGIFSGTSTAPTLILTATLGDTVGTYTASYITADSVFGNFVVEAGGGSPLAGTLALKKQ
jgi:hypothetical protein